MFDAAAAATTPCPTMHARSSSSNSNIKSNSSTVAARGSSLAIAGRQQRRHSSNNGTAAAAAGRHQLRPTLCNWLSSQSTTGRLYSARLQRREMLSISLVAFSPRIFPNSCSRLPALISEMVTASVSVQMHFSFLGFPQWHFFSFPSSSLPYFHFRSFRWGLIYYVKVQGHCHIQWVLN